MNNVDKQYFDLLNQILTYGNDKDDRTGTGTISIFGANMRFNLKDGFPLLTTKKLHFKGIKEELLWFLKGDTNIKYLVDRGVNIWNDDAFRWYLNVTKITCGDNFPFYTKEEFIDTIRNCERDNIKHLPFFDLGDLGNVYGKSWRSFGSTNTDQIKNVIETLKTNPDDRRMLVVTFNPDELNNVALPPCHVMFQFYTRNLTYNERFEILQEKYEETNEYKAATNAIFEKYNIPQRALSCMFFCRSQDVPLGTPYNIASYALLTHMIAQCVNMEVDELIYNGGDCHIYANQTEQIKEQLERDPHKYSLPKLWLNPDIKNIDDFSSDDIKIEKYEYYPSIKIPLSVGL